MDGKTGLTRGFNFDAGQSCRFIEFEGKIRVP